VIKIDEKFIKERIAKLRTDKNISARELSLQLGQSTGYINTIENGNSLPSMGMFLYICDYFHITPQEFFDVGNEYPELLDKIVNECKKLDKSSLESILHIIKTMNR
jgi:transcriptional regulator with XRE-family HTH domain